MTKRATYRQLRDTLSTGDLLLFDGDGIISRGIQLLTDSHFSHIGMAIVSSELDTIFCWESTTLSTVKDADTGLATKGVQLVLLSDRLNTYQGKVSVRHLLGESLTEHDLRDLSSLRQRLKGTPYEEDDLELLFSALDYFDQDDGEEDLSSLFCSELVAEAYQTLGLLPPCKPSNEYTPADFSEKEDMELLNGFHLGDEIKIREG